MTKVDELYVCRICGNAVEVVMAGAGVLVCCGEPMELVEEDDE
jgi:superoxide reductase